MKTINLTTFEELKQISGDEFINELIQAFLEEAPTMLNEMQTALDSSDVDTFRRNAHSLKSNASTFGADELAELARELESLARENKLADVGQKLDKLSTLCNQVQTDLKSMMK